MFFNVDEKEKVKETIAELLKSSGVVLIIRRDDVPHIRHDMTNRHSLDRTIILTNLEKTREVEDDETMEKFIEEELEKGNSYDVFPRFIHINMNFQGTDGSRFKMRTMNLEGYGKVMVQFVYKPFERKVELNIENQKTDHLALIYTIVNANISANNPLEFKTFCNLFIKTLSEDEERKIIDGLNKVVEANGWTKEELYY